METSSPKYAVVRQIPDSYIDCVKYREPEGKIDVELARTQHNEYCSALEGLSLSLIRIDSDEQLPDCCFVEDTAIVVRDVAIISNMAVASRWGEAYATKQVLKRNKRVYDLKHPGVIDGGDVLRIDDKLYIGLSGRTNQSAIEQVREIVSGYGYQVIPVAISDTLHLKSACTYIGKGCVVLYPGHFNEEVFADYNKITVSPDESYSANCLAVNGHVLVAKGYPQNRRMVESQGFEVVELDMSEFRKGGGSLTCLSIIF